MHLFTLIKVCLFIVCRFYRSLYSEYESDSSIDSTLHNAMEEPFCLDGSIKNI